MISFFKNFLLILGCLMVVPACLNSKKDEENKKNNLVVVNVLDKELYDDCHIKGSIQVPFEELTQYAEQHWDKNKTKVVVYCANKQCTASITGAKQLIQMGFKPENIWAYEGGSAAAIQEGLPVEGLCKQGYLKDYQKVEESEKEGVQIISSQNLKKMMEEFATF